MIYQKLILIIVAISGFGISYVNAQNSINSSGGNATGTGGTSSYSIGQLVYSVNSSTDGSISEGVQQPYEISVVTEIPESKNIDLNIITYPNPAKDFIILKVDNYETSGLELIIYDNQGKILYKENVSSSETKIDISNYSSAIYIAKINNKKETIKTFKINKL